jgi:predicted metalloprotease with PDZ domain
LNPVERQARTYEASCYDELVDCPVMMGNHRVETFEVRGVPHHVALVGEGNYEVGQLLDDTRKIVEQGFSVFEDLPYSDYTFFMEMASEGYGGLEHTNSTHMIFPQWGFKPRKDYVVALGLISHEYFHTWNVKRLRPAPLGPFDYSREVYTPLLWFAEGFTSYYDLLLLRRGGSITVREYLDELGREIRRLSLSPGRLVQSLEESSFDTWIKLYHPTPDSPNTTISYYNKGCLFGMVLDLSIRHRTRNRRNLDHVMRLLYREHYKKRNQGFSSEDIESACEEVVGRSLKPLFDRCVRDVDEIDWGRYLSLAGLEIASKQKPVPEKKRKPGDETARSYLGLRLKPQAGVVVAQVIAGGGAHKAGLAPGDELLALDGFRLDESKLEKLLGQLPPGREVLITLSRAGMLREVGVVLTGRPLVEFSIQPKKTATVAEKALCKEWLREGWKKVDRPAHGLDFRPRERVF